MVLTCSRVLTSATYMHRGSARGEAALERRPHRMLRPRRIDEEPRPNTEMTFD